MRKTISETCSGKRRGNSGCSVIQESNLELLRRVLSTRDTSFIDIVASWAEPDEVCSSSDEWILKSELDPKLSVTEEMPPPASAALHPGILFTGRHATQTWLSGQLLLPLPTQAQNKKSPSLQPPVNLPAHLFLHLSPAAIFPPSEKIHRTTNVKGDAQ